MPKIKALSGKNRVNKYPSKTPHPLAQSLEPSVPETQYVALLDQFNLKTNTEFDANLYTVLLNLSEGVRLNRVMREWVLLNSNATCINSSVLRTYYTIEAEHYLAKFESSNDPIFVISATDQFNLCGMDDRAVELLQKHVYIRTNKNKKIGAFYCLAYATSLYALRKFEDAKTMALASVELSKKEIATCMLLGAIYLHLGLVRDSIHWYERAQAIGADAEECDEAMRNAVKIVALSKRHIVIQELYSLHTRYKFLRGLLPQKKRGYLR